MVPAGRCHLCIRCDHSNRNRILLRFVAVQPPVNELKRTPLHTLAPDMNQPPEGIVRRDFRQGKIAYNFQWNRSNHEKLGHLEGDLASLWAHLSAVCSGKIPEAPFSDPFYTRASSLRLSKMPPASRVGLRRRLMRHGLITSNAESDLVTRIRSYHRAVNSISYAADHSIVQRFMFEDPTTIAVEVPVWSETLRLSGHIDLLRCVEGQIQVCDYKPGPLDSAQNRFLESLPQVSAYGEMMAHHLSSTLRSALDAPILPRITCCIFDAHSCWQFGAELFVNLQALGLVEGH